MKRLLFSSLKQWRDSPQRTPLLIRGARQVGKTHLIRQFGNLFDSFIEVNFEKSPALIQIFNQDLDPFRIIKELSIALNKKIIPGESLLFFDEIQQAPQAITAMRYFYEELPSLHLIGAGSLIDFAIEKVGVPVGRISFLYMYPMSYIEFLHAKNEISLAVELIEHDPKLPINEAIHQKSLKLLGEYMAIGGMPQSVYQWISHQDIKICVEVLQNIKNAYQQDFEKYAKKHQIKYVELLFQQIPTVISQHIKFSNLSEVYRRRELEPALELLEKAGIVHKIIQTKGSGIPLGAQAKLNNFKLSMLDIALTQNILGLEFKSWFLEPEITLVNKGGITENFVGQEILAYSNPKANQQLYYWHRESRSSNAEVDYLIVNGSKVLPIEVKSGHGGNLQSIKLFLESHTDSSYGIRFSTHNYSVFDKVHSYPLYAVVGALESKKDILAFLEEI